MNLKAQKTPYSSVVGGGVLLTDETGKAVFNIMICGTTQGITKEQSDEISKRLLEGFNRADTALPVEAIKRTIKDMPGLSVYDQSQWLKCIDHLVERGIIGKGR